MRLAFLSFFVVLASMALLRVVELPPNQALDPHVWQRPNPSFSDLPRMHRFLKP